MKGLERVVAMIVSAGHPGAWDYPLSVFDAAVDALTEQARRAEQRG